MTKKMIEKILRDHKSWLDDEGGQRAEFRGADLRDANLNDADLRDANLIGAHLRNADLNGSDLRSANLVLADLRGANLREADLRDANFSGANLCGADIDYASWPLWCGALDVTIDARIAAQLVYHVVRACQSVTDDQDVVAFCNDPVVARLANRFHRAEECGLIEVKESEVAK